MWLDSLYKIYASLIQIRLSAGIDKFIMKTQFGFRKHKSTAQAMYLARRVLDLGEQGTEEVTLLLLDWEKAFVVECYCFYRYIIVVVP